jgi:SAM-dependent methyltransferase
MSGWHPDTPVEYRNQIVTGDARELAKRLPDASVDLVFCDPVYWFIQDYHWLATTALRVLRPGGSVIAQVGTQHRHMAEVAMQTSGLVMRPLLAEIFTGGNYQMWVHRSLTGWKPYIWLTKGDRTGEWVPDCVRGGGRAKGEHAWGDSPDAFRVWISRLTLAGGIVLDPFAGGGTVPAVCKQLGRNYIAFEIEPETATIARERVHNTPEPLFVMDEAPSQEALAL